MWGGTLKPQSLQFKLVDRKSAGVGRLYRD